MSNRKKNLENGYSETIVDHFDHNKMEKDMLEVEKIGTFENGNPIPNQNIVINDFSEEVDKDGVCGQTNMVHFIGQIFLSKEESVIFYQRYAYYHGFSILKGRFIKKQRWNYWSVWFFLS